MKKQKLDNNSAAKILAGLCSFLFPGLGQLLLNRVQSALYCFLGFLAGWIMALKIIQDALNSYYTPSYGQTLIGLFLALIPHLFSAYWAANGSRLKTE